MSDAARGRHQAIVVCGNAGSGKSTYGRQRARDLGAALVDIDACTERLAKLVLAATGLPEQDRDSPEYKALLRDPIYEALFDIAVDNLQHTPVVVVGPFTTERRDVAWPARLAQRLGTDVEIVYVHCAPEVRRQRMVARGNPRDAGKLAAWQNYAAQGVDDAAPPYTHTFVDTTAG